MRASLSASIRTRAPSWPRAVAAALLAPAVLALAAPASANGRYPAAGLIAVDPSDPAHLIVRATYGVLSTRDRGGEWRWICEAAIGFGGFEDPMVAILADGTILAGVFKGLSASKSGGCDWAFAGGDLTNRYVTDLSAERADPSRAVLVISNGIGSGQFITQLWETTDSAGSWTQAGIDLPGEFLAFTVDVAPSDPSRVYVSGRYGAPDYLGAIERSPDRGQTWERLDIPGADDLHLAYLGAIDPADPDRIYVRLDADPSDSLIVSTTGGETWTTAFQGQGDLLGFEISPDGATVLIGGPQDGLWRAPAATLQFEKIADTSVRCLTWTADGLLACASELADGFTAGVSIDEGESFTPILHLDTLCGPLECAVGSSVEAICTDQWGATQLALDTKDCGPVETSSSSGSGVAPVDLNASGGGGCRVGGAAWPLSWAALAAAAVAVLARKLGGRRSSERGHQPRRSS